MGDSAEKDGERNNWSGELQEERRTNGEQDSWSSDGIGPWDDGFGGHFWTGIAYGTEKSTEIMIG